MSGTHQRPVTTKTTRTPGRPMQPTRPWPLRTGTLAALGLLGALAAYVWLRPEADNLPEFRTYPHAYVAAPVFDPAQVAIRTGPLPGPAQIELDGQILWPAYVCSDRTLVPDRNGQPCIFPLISGADGGRSPPLPPRGVVLSGSQLRLAQPYLTPEAKAILASFAERMQ